MSIEYDEKGKYYTEVVAKQPTPAVIQTATHLVRGFVHVRQGERFKDEIERDERFIAITQATIHGAGDQILFSAPFVAIQRAQIVWAMPVEEAGLEDANI
ncbi:MAG: hypothetical protein HYZ23_08660 [Chloroflexi bacterium]|nr:hypothetical protein [Chloroflexota bacterium]